MNRKNLSVIAVTAAIAIISSIKSYAQDDILDLASNLTAKSSELQKVQDDLRNQRQEVKKEAEAVKKEEQKVADMRAYDKMGKGPFSVDSWRPNLSGGDGVDRGYWPGFYDSKYNTLDDLKQALAEILKYKARADADLRQHAWWSIRDAAGNDLGTEETFSGGVGSRPRPPGDLRQAEAALVPRKSASDKAIEKYLADKAKYDKDLAAYNDAVNKLNQSLPAAIQDAGTPTPTADQLSAPKGDYQVDDLTALATQYKGQTAKDGTATAFVQDAAKLPDPSKWGKGTKVGGAVIRAGTPIATFKADGTHAPGTGSHSALYITQNAKGVWVYDQYKTATGEQRPVDTRFIRFKNGKGSPSNDASAYSVISKKTVVPPPIPN